MKVKQLTTKLFKIVTLSALTFPLAINATESQEALQKEMTELKQELNLIKKALIDLKTENKDAFKTAEYQVENPNTETLQPEKEKHKSIIKNTETVKNKYPKKNNKDIHPTVSENQSIKKDTSPAETSSQTKLPYSTIGTPLSWSWEDLLVEVHGSISTGFNKTNGQDSFFDLVDFNPLFLANYRDLFLFRAAVDFSINQDGDTDTSLDFANINLFLNDYMIFGAGKFDSALGQFVQNISPAWINKLPSAPIGFDGDQAPTSCKSHQVLNNPNIP